MHRRAVPLVPGKTVLRVLFVVFAHERIAVDFGEDARRTDTVRQRVAPHDVLLRKINADAEISVHEHDVRLYRKPLHRALHAPFGGFQNIDLVDGLRAFLTNFVSDGALADECGQLLAPLFLYLFAVVHAVYEVFRVQRHDDGRAHHRPGKRPPPHLVDAGDVFGAEGEHLFFVREFVALGLHSFRHNFYPFCIRRKMLWGAALAEKSA